MPRDALQRGGGKNQLGWFYEHFNRMLRQSVDQVNEFALVICRVRPVTTIFLQNKTCKGDYAPVVSTLF